MFAPLIAALTRILAWFTGPAVIKWLFALVATAGFALLLDVLLSLLPAWFDGASLQASAAWFPPEVWYFIDYFQLQQGLGLMFSAYVARFLIRRLPVIG